MARLFAKGDAKGALKIHTRLFPLFRNLFIETNPVPVKAALVMKRMMEEEYRLPLVKMDPKNREVLRKTLESCGVLS